MDFLERLADRSLSNPRAQRVKDVAALTRRSTRLKRGLFRAEGPQNVREALRVAAGELPGGEHLPSLDAVYVTRAELERHPQLAQLLERVAAQRTVFVREVTADVLARMTDALTPQGVLAVCRIPQPSLPASLHAASLACALVRTQDPGNAGTVIRAADAAGAQLVALTEHSVDPYNPKAVRSSAGSLFHVPVLTDVALGTLVDGAHEAGLTVLAADGHAEATVTDLADDAAARALGAVPPDGAHAPSAGGPRLDRPTLWLFGNEAQGLDASERECADLAVAVPLYGAAESLNVATAATVCLYASATAQRRSTAQQSGTGAVHS